MSVPRPTGLDSGHRPTRDLCLLIALLLLVVVHPFVHTTWLAVVLQDLSLLIIVTAGIYAVSRKRLAFLIS